MLDVLFFFVAFLAVAQGRYNLEPVHRIHQSCDTEIHLGLSESFAFTNFPFKSQSCAHTFVHSYFDSIPRECTLTFKAQGECMLTWETTHYERGDIDCSVEYLIVGDNNSEKWICGFGRPPGRLNSSGDYLFLTHYQRQRNGHPYGTVINSRITGVVRCEMKVSTKCAPQTQKFIGGGAESCHKAGPCNVQRLSDLSVVAACETNLGRNCHWEVRFWQAYRLLNASCKPPLPTLQPTTPGANCTTINETCLVGDSDCEVSGQTYKIIGDILTFIREHQFTNSEHQFGTI